MIYDIPNVYRPRIVYPQLHITPSATINDVEAWLKLDNEISNKLNREIEIRATILLNLKREMKSWT